MLLTICLTIVFLSLLALHISIRYNEAGRMLDKIPGPMPLPFFGNILMFNLPPDKLWDKLHQLLNEYYPIIRLWKASIHSVFIRHPDDMKALLSCKKNINKSDTIYGTFRNIDSDGLIISGGEKWRQRRKMITPAFNPNLLRVYTEIANEHAEKVIKNLKNKNLEIIPDVVSMCLKLAIGIICEATMGVDLNHFGDKKEEEFRHLFDQISDIAFYRLSRPYLHDWMMKFLTIGRRQARALKIGREFINWIILERRKYHEKVGYQNIQSMVDDEEDDTPTNRRKRLAVLDLLLAAEMDNLIDERGVKEEVETFIIAGYESSGVGMGLALFLLAENKAAQEMARDEVTELLNRTGGILTIADISKLDYLDRCIKETLRIFPPAPLIGRKITDNIKLTNYDIPHATEVGIQIFSLHRDPNFWPNPEKFDPDRFLPENINKRHPFAYAPFSAGPRMCLAHKFATLELKLVVARMLYNFILEPVDSTVDMKFKLHVTLKPRDPLRMKLIKIDRQSTS